MEAELELLLRMIPLSRLQKEAPNIIPKAHPSPSMIPKILLLVKEIRPRTTQVDNLRTPIPILLQPRAFETVESVRDALLPTTHPLISEVRG